MGVTESCFLKFLKDKRIVCRNAFAMFSLLVPLDSLEVRVGDILLEVNGQSGDTRTMMDSFWQSLKAFSGGKGCSQFHRCFKTSPIF